MSRTRAQSTVHRDVLKPGLDNSFETLVASRTMARAYALHHVENDAIALARAFTLAAAESWWNSAAPNMPLRPFDSLSSLPQLPAPLSALAITIGAAAKALPADQAGYQLGLVYTSMLPAEFRAKHGVFYTPPALAERMLDQVTAAGLDWKTAHVLDPACGGGAFLAPVAKRIVAALGHCEPAILLKNIRTRLAGYELDPFAAWLSQITLDAVLLPICQKAGRQLPWLVQVADTLSITNPTRQFDLVIGNPPYGRVRLSTERRQEFRRALYGHANLYALFMDLAIRHAKPTGHLAYLTPTSFLAGEYFKNLRSMLAEQARPVIIDLVTVRKGVFEDVLQEVLLATYRRGSKRKTADVHIAEPISETQLTVRAAGTFHLPQDASQPWLMPRTDKEVDLLKSLRKLEYRLSDWGYSISTGPLVWNRHKSQLASTNGPDTLPLIWAEAITSDGRFIWRAGKRNHAPYFRIQNGDEWLIVRDACVLLQRTTAKEQNRRLIAAALPASFLARHKAVVIENHINMIRPLNSRPKVAPEILAAFLNSEVADRAFRCLSGSVAVSAYELEALPLPNPDSLAPIADLIARSSPGHLIEQACTRLYGKSVHK
jgi:adenine-specific DNA-methyltransferase